MGNITEINETHILNKEGIKVSVKVGDKIKVKAEIGFLADKLGTDPLTISWVGKWPCNRTMLYVKTLNSELGDHAHKFIAA